MLERVDGKHFSDWTWSTISKIASFLLKTQAFYWPFTGRLWWNFSFDGNREASASTGQRRQEEVPVSHLHGRSAACISEDRVTSKGIMKEARAALWQPNWQSQGHVSFWKTDEFSGFLCLIVPSNHEKRIKFDFNDMPQGASGQLLFLS